MVTQPDLGCEYSGLYLTRCWCTLYPKSLIVTMSSCKPFSPVQSLHCSAVAFFSCDEENEWFEERCILCNTCRFGYVPTWWDLNFPKGKDYSWYSLRTSPRSISQQQGRYATSRQSGDIALDIAGEDQMSTLYTTKDNRTPVAVLWLTYPFSGW